MCLQTHIVNDCHCRINLYSICKAHIAHAHRQIDNAPCPEYKVDVEYSGVGCYKRCISQEENKYTFDDGGYSIIDHKSRQHAEWRKERAEEIKREKVRKHIEETNKERAKLGLSPLKAEEDDVKVKAEVKDEERDEGDGRCMKKARVSLDKVEKKLFGGSPCGSTGFTYGMDFRDEAQVKVEDEDVDVDIKDTQVMVKAEDDDGEVRVKAEERDEEMMGLNHAVEHMQLEGNQRISASEAFIQAQLSSVPSDVSEHGSDSFDTGSDEEGDDEYEDDSDTSVNYELLGLQGLIPDSRIPDFRAVYDQESYSGSDEDDEDSDEQHVRRRHVSRQSHQYSDSDDDASDELSDGPDDNDYDAEPEPAPAPAQVASRPGFSVIDGIEFRADGDCPEDRSYYGGGEQAYEQGDDDVMEDVEEGEDDYSEDESKKAWYD